MAQTFRYCIKICIYFKKHKKYNIINIVQKTKIISKTRYNANKYIK